jgi:hypothetical protein
MPAPVGVDAKSRVACRESLDHAWARSHVGFLEASTAKLAPAQKG